jgi:uncharacterized membrane protein YeaQ/YmgE (transglycosylase-associated protein family)
MYILAWIIIGLVVAWVSRKLLTEDNDGPVLDLIMGVAGAIVGGVLMRFAGSSGHSGLVYTSVAAILGAGLAGGISAYLSARSGYA